MRTNTAPAPAVFTHEGAPASRISPLDELRRTVLACLLWERGFYESGEEVAERIKRLVALCQPHDVAALAIDARTKQRLRHVPLLLVRELARTPARGPDGLVARTLRDVVQRADELAEFLALYWQEGRKPIGKQVKRGLAWAFRKFDAYQLGKYNRDNAIKLRDVLFMVHAKPKDDEQAALWKSLVDGTLPTPDTWEVALSAGADKRETFERLLRTGMLGDLALLRNLRNMRDAGVDRALIFEALERGAAKSKALPFRYVAAARAVPEFEPQLDRAMLAALAGAPKLAGSTVLLIDVSGSMEEKLSAKSDLERLDAACALAVLLRGVSGDDCRVFTFSDRVVEVAARQGMALIEAVRNSQPHSGTELGNAVATLAIGAAAKADRLIVVTDEQSHDRVPAPPRRGYMLNVATDRHGVGYGAWVHINGFSESVVQFVAELEAQVAPGAFD